MNRATTLIFSLAAMMAVAASADAQGRGRGQAKNDVPPGQRPPAGMCRIWIDGVPPGHQPAPTDCETAVRNQPPHSRIIWGDDVSRRGRGVRDSDRRREDDRRRNEDRPRGDDRQRGDDRRPTDRPSDRGVYPSQLPAMTGAVLIRVGVRTPDVQNWLGRGDLRSETVDANGDGVPERASWYDRQGTLLQVWRDEDRDGRADAVEVYRNGQRVQVVR